MLVSTWSRGGRSEAGILLKTEGLTIATFAPVSARKVTPTPEMLPLTRGHPQCWLLVLLLAGESGALRGRGSRAPARKQVKGFDL